MIEIELNGDRRELGEPASVVDAVRELGVESERGVAVALDGEIVPRKDWSRTPLATGVSVEVVRAVQGG